MSNLAQEITTSTQGKLTLEVLREFVRATQHLPDGTHVVAEATTHGPRRLYVKEFVELEGEDNENA